MSGPIAEIANRFGDPEAFAERELRVLADIQKLPIGARLYLGGHTELLEALRECVEEIKNIWNAEPMSNESKAVLRLAAHAISEAERQA